MGTPAQEQQQEQSREWSNSLWGCCSPAGTCFTACCCPCLLFGKTQSRMEDPALKEYSHMNGDCCLFTLAGYFGLSGILLMLKRGEMRKRFGIEGNGCTDCLVACCCTCCALVQHEKEVEAQSEKMLAGGYQAPAAMAYPS